MYQTRINVIQTDSRQLPVFGKAAFEKMKEDAVFINCARGPLVDESALFEALSSKCIRAAGINVKRNRRSMSR